MIDVFIALFLGFAVGVLTGLLPGIHTNTIIAFLSGSYLFFSGSFSDFSFVVFVVSVGITSSFVNVIPSVFLGVPSPDSELLPLPAHKLVLQGRALEAVFVSSYACFVSFFFSVLLSPFIALFLIFALDFIKEYVGFFIIAILFWLFARQKYLFSIFVSIVVFLLSGFLGLIVLDSFSESLFLVFSGLFGVSNVVVSLFESNHFINQKNSVFDFKLKNFLKPLFACVFSSSFINLFPGLGPSQASVLVLSFFKRISDNNFIFIINGSSVVDFVVSLITLFSISKARNGAVVFAQNFLGEISFFELLIFVFASLFCACLSFVFILKSSRFFLYLFSRIDFRIVNWCVILAIFMLAFFFSGFYGILIILVSAMIGLIPIFSQTPRSNCMGVLLLPYLVFFFS